MPHHQHDLSDGGYDVESECRQHEVDGASAAIDGAVECSGVAVHVKGEVERVEVSERLTGHVTQSHLHHTGEQQPTQLVQQRRRGASDAIAQQHSQWESDQCLLARLYDGV